MCMMHQQESIYSGLKYYRDGDILIRYKIIWALGTWRGK